MSSPHQQITALTIPTNNIFPQFITEQQPCSVLVYMRQKSNGDQSIIHHHDQMKSYCIITSQQHCTTFLWCPYIPLTWLHCIEETSAHLLNYLVTKLEKIPSIQLPQDAKGACGERKICIKQDLGELTIDAVVWYTTNSFVSQASWLFRKHRLKRKDRAFQFFSLMLCETLSLRCFIFCNKAH